VAALLPEYLPVPQSAHVEVTEAPVAAEDLPAAQDTQESEVPTVVRYLPATQLMHTVAAAAVHFVYVLSWDFGRGTACHGLRSAVTDAGHGSREAGVRRVLYQ